MADLPSPYLAQLLGNNDPNTTSDYFDAQRKQMMAQMLMQNTQQSAQTPADWNSMKLVPKRSILSSIMPIASGYLSGQAYQGAQQAQGKYFSDLSASPMQSPQSQPQQQPQQPQGGGMQSPQAQPPQQTPQAQTVPGFGPNMNPQRALQLMASGDPGGAKIGEAYMTQYFGTPEWRTALQANNGNIGAAQQQLQAKAKKEAYIAPIDAKPNTPVLDPNTLQPKFIAPNPAPAGAEYQRDATGNYAKDANGGYIIKPTQGGTAAIQAEAKAREAGEQSQKAIELGVDADGKKIYGYPSPPAATGSNGPQPSKYFINATTPGQTASPGQQEYQKSGAKGAQEYSSELVKNATGATEVRRSLSELKNLSQQATPGAANDSKAKLGAFMIAAGADPQNVSAWLGVDTGALQAAQKQTATLAVNSIHSMTSRGTNFDLDTFMKNNPNMNMADPQAFARVADYMDNKAKQDIAKQRDFVQFKKENPMPPEELEAAHTAHWLDQQNQEIDKGHSNSRNPNAPKASLQELMAEAQKRGLKVPQ